jgi:hypothetical protein
MTKLVGILLGAGAAAVVAIAGCYNTTNVKSGGLVCGANDACPDGFHCEKDGASGASGHCYRNGSGLLGDGGTGKTDTATGPACSAPVAPFGPFAGCTATLPTTTSACDPVCQSGCACDRRCVVDGTTYDRFECETSPQAPSSFVPVQGDCSGDKYASCVPGSVCIADDYCPWQCFRTCRQDGDCPRNSSCSVLTLLDMNNLPVPNVWLCTPPTETCNPTGTAACASARDGFACVFLAGMTTLTTDATVCDCATIHTKRVGAACSRQGGHPDDCQAGAACVEGVCRQVCDRQATGAGCTSGTCTPLYGSARWGYCR